MRQEPKIEKNRFGFVGQDELEQIGQKMAKQERMEQIKNRRNLGGVGLIQTGGVELSSMTMTKSKTDFRSQPMSMMPSLLGDKLQSESM